MTSKQEQSNLINAASVIAAPFTGGLSLIGLTIPFLMGGNDEEERRRREEDQKNRDKQYAEMMQVHKDGISSRQKETENLLKAIKEKNGEAERITSVLNNPHSSEEEKSKARKQLVVLEDEIKADKKKLQALEKELERMRNNPPSPPTIPFRLPKLELFDKIILASGLSLVTYLIMSKESKKK